MVAAVGVEEGVVFVGICFFMSANGYYYIRVGGEVISGLRPAVEGAQGRKIRWIFRA